LGFNKVFISLKPEDIMKEEFFEGKDFKGGEFKALMPKYYPEEYRKYLEEETLLIKEKLIGSRRVLEAGVGIGRLIPELVPLVGEFIGVDNAELMLDESRKVAESFKNVKIIKANLEDLDKIFEKSYFDYSLCIWNTLGNIKDEVEVLKNLAYVTSKSIIITVYLKGTLKNRENWYKTVGIKISNINKAKEIFYSESGLSSKSYNLEEIADIAKKARLKIKDSKILNKVILFVELIKS
jgi:ubiquinone/menaquinone biosynthesis C-methylase UbiE